MPPDLPTHLLLPDVDAVTGAFSYSGRAMAAELLRRGRHVRTRTGHPGRAPAGTPIDVRPLDFGDPRGMRESLEGVGTLFNTYWVRFGHGRVTHDLAVRNSIALFAAAKEVGVQRIVHVSITHPSADSPFPYFRGKAEVEEALAGSGIPHTILRPAILFGGDGVLINNIAWLLRRLPVFAVGGGGAYRVRPMHIDDLARLAVDSSAAEGAAGSSTVDAVGLERPRFIDMVRQLKDAIGVRTPIVRVPGFFIPVAGAVLNLALRDVVLTADEYKAMAAGLADTDGPATGDTSLGGWISANAPSLGRTYAHEIKRHFRN
ncbi:MAG TPA: NAD(P)H-binding protein [Acidimicrobiales bacterium]|nr:NAD(P)H-binding protein [Acidimicrobiales bacterium]